MIVKENMNRNIYSIDSTLSVRQAIREMIRLGINRLFVFDKKNNPTGIISYKDVLLLLGSNETMLDIDTVKVYDIMSENVITIDAHEEIENAANLMLRADVSGLLVTENGENIGVITKTDICRIVSLSKINPK